MILYMTNYLTYELKVNLMALARNHTLLVAATLDGSMVVIPDQRLVTLQYLDSLGSTLFLSIPRIAHSY